MEPLLEYPLDLAGGTRVRALELQGDGAPLLLLHGFGDSADTWRPVLDRLARAGQRAMAIDFPGYGRATRLRVGAVLPQLDAAAAEVVERLTEEAGEPAVVVGNSLGGTVALRLGERAEALPIAGVMPIAPAGLEMPRWFEAIERDPVLRRVLAMPVPIPDVVLRHSVGEVYRRLAFARPAEVEAAVIDTFYRHHQGRAGVAALLEAGRRLLPELTIPYRPLALERIAVPVLLVWGRLDRMVPHSGARKVMEALPQTDLVMLEDCGHCPQIEMPAEVTELMQDFARARVASRHHEASSPPARRRPARPRARRGADAGPAA